MLGKRKIRYRYFLLISLTNKIKIMDTTYIKDLEYIDQILKFLRSEPTQTLTYNVLLNKLTDNDTKGLSNFMGHPIKVKDTYEWDPSDKLSNAIDFLQKKEMISGEKIEGYKITYFGILKLSSGGFIGEYEKNKHESSFLREVHRSTKLKNYRSLYISFFSLIISTGVLLISILVYLSKCK